VKNNKQFLLNNIIVIECGMTSRKGAKALQKKLLCAVASLREIKAG